MSRHAAVFSGVALFAAALIVLGAAWGSGSDSGSRREEPLRLLPAAGSALAAPPPQIAATPVPERSLALAEAPSAGIWSTPAEFAPPE